jgi:hypothetical protein
MNEQTRAATLAATPAEHAAAAPQEDAWDRLAALAFGDTASASGCSEHAHDCTCLAQHGSAGSALVAASTPEPDEEDVEFGG